MNDSFNELTPWNEYPRPAFKRDSFFTLNGEWEFEICKSETAPIKYSQKITVPFPPESELSGIKKTVKKGERLYYRRNFYLPDNFKKEKTLLHFGAVDQICEVWLNGEYLGKHEGGYLPFSFDVTKHLKDENVLCVKSTDDISLLYPYGKQKRKRGGMWYTPVSGIWQTVWIESLPQNNIDKLKISSTTSKAIIEVFGGENEKRITLTESNESFVFTGNTISISPSQKQLWTPETPYLYHFILESGEDKVESYFALREISSETIDGVPRLCLNGKPYLFHGLLDQGYFQDGIFLPKTSEGYEKDILTAKSLGFNMLRKHIKIEPPIFYHLCDKLGMAVFQDIVNNSDYSFIRDTALPTIGLKKLPDKFMHPNKKSRNIFIQHMKDTVSYLYNTPSILYYTIFNEGWGQFDADKMYEIFKEIDKTRIADSTSGWFTRKKSDVDSHHIYFKKLRAEVDCRPVVISEFGGYSHRVEGHLFGKANYGYSTCKTREDFSLAIEKLYLEEVLPLVKKGVSALVYTQISDVEDETNGFLTYDREVLKIDAKKFKEISDKLFLASSRIEK